MNFIRCSIDGTFAEFVLNMHEYFESTCKFYMKFKHAQFKPQFKSINLQLVQSL